MGISMAKAKEGKHHFPKTLKGFKYQFNTDGQLRHTETGNQFEFMVRDNDHQYNQRRYEALGKVINEYVYSQLEEETQLKRTKIPVDAEADEPTGFFFASNDAETNVDRLMVIIHGSGVVRAGQWSRRLIINDCLETGSQLPYIKKAIERGYAVIVTNTNLNHEDDDRSKRPIRGSESPEEHMLYVWRNFVKNCPARHIDVLAHSYGGIVTVNWLNIEQDARDRVRKVAFTDSVHGMYKQGVTQETADWFIKNSINWVSTFARLNTYQGQVRNDVHKLSAGTEVHELTSHSCFDTIFKYFSTEETTFKFLNREAVGLEAELTFSNSKTTYREGEDEIDEPMSEQVVNNKPQEQELEESESNEKKQRHEDTLEIVRKEKKEAEREEQEKATESEPEKGHCPHTDDEKYVNQLVGHSVGQLASQFPLSVLQPQMDPQESCKEQKLMQQETSQSKVKEPTSGSLTKPLGEDKEKEHAEKQQNMENKEEVTDNQLTETVTV